MSLLRSVTVVPAAALHARRRHSLDPFRRRVLSVIAESLYRIEEELELGDSLVEDLGVDSLDYVELVLALEREFDVKVEDDEAVRLRTVSDVIEYIGRLTRFESNRSV